MNAVDAIADLLVHGQWISAAGTAAMERAEAAGLTLGPETFFGMICVRRAANDIEHVWLDVGEAVRVLGDASDEDDSFLLTVVELLGGRDSVERFQQALESDVYDFKPFVISL